VWWKDQLIGRKEWLEPLFHQCVVVGSPHHRSDKAIWVQISNACDADILLERTGDVGPAKLELPAGTTSLVQIAAGKSPDPIELKYIVKNLLIGPGAGLPVSLRIPAR
jgi:hypothetical protein